MGSDDVRARAEARLRAVIEAMDDPAIGDIVRALPECERLRAALAVAPATAVEEARKAFCDATVREAAMNGRWKRMVLGKPLDGERVVPCGEAADDLASAGVAMERARLALLSAEAAATHAAKESRSDDRPAAASGDSEGGDDGR